MKEKPNMLAKAIRKAIDADDRSLYAIGRAADVPYQGLHPFVRGKRTAIDLHTADRLCRVLGLELVPQRKEG